MKNKFILFAFVLSILLNLLFFLKIDPFFANYNTPNKKTILADYKNTVDSLDIKFYNAHDFLIWGKIHTEKNFNRLPKKYKNGVRPAVWNLSECSTGIQIRFQTNSPTIWVKWKLSKNTHLQNMTKIGVSGVDLYCETGEVWQFVNSGIPSGLESTIELISGMSDSNKKFLLNLPLYDGIESLEIGIKKDSRISTAEGTNEPTKNSIIFYGTSITQGGSASRPGMAYPSIISRHLNIETINLGFSSNGRFEQSIGRVICNETNPILIVIDCTPNSPPDTINKNALPLLRQLRKCHTETPILLVESIYREYAYFKTQDQSVSGSLDFIRAQNEALKNTFIKAKEIGVENLHYLENNGLIGYDHEATVDGTHLNDLGQYRMANMIKSKIKEILKIE